MFDLAPVGSNLGSGLEDQDWDGGFVGDFFGDRSEEEMFEFGAAMGADDDEVGFFGFGKGHDFLERGSGEDTGLAFEAGVADLVLEFVQLVLGGVLELLKQARLDYDGRASLGAAQDFAELRAGDGMEENDPGVKGLGITGRILDQVGAEFREVERDHDLFPKHNPILGHLLVWVKARRLTSGREIKHNGIKISIWGGR